MYIIIYDEFVLEMLESDDLVATPNGGYKIRLVHIHTQNLYPTTHRPPTDIRLHNSCCAAEDIGFSGL